MCAIDCRDVQFNMTICSIENALKHWEMLLIIKCTHFDEFARVLGGTTQTGNLACFQRFLAKF